MSNPTLGLAWAWAAALHAENHYISYMIINYVMRGIFTSVEEWITKGLPLVRMNNNNTTRGDSPRHHRKTNPINLKWVPAYLHGFVNPWRALTRNLPSLEIKYYKGDSPHCHQRNKTRRRGESPLVVNVEKKVTRCVLPTFSRWIEQDMMGRNTHLVLSSMSRCKGCDKKISDHIHPRIHSRVHTSMI